MEDLKSSYDYNGVIINIKKIERKQISKASEIWYKIKYHKHQVYNAEEKEIVKESEDIEVNYEIRTSYDCKINKTIF